MVIITVVFVSIFLTEKRKKEEEEREVTPLY